MPGLSTLPSFSSSEAAAESCSTPEGLFQALGASHGQGPGGRPGLDPGNQRQEETGSRSSAGFTFRAPDRLTPSGQGLPATGPARQVHRQPQPRRRGEAGGRRLEAAQPDRETSVANEHWGRGAGIDAPWKVTAAGAPRAGRSPMGAGSPGGQPPPPPWRRAGFPERSGLEPLVRCRRCGQPGAANGQARDPRFPRGAGRESLCGDRRGSALAGAGVGAPG